MLHTKSIDRPTYVTAAQVCGRFSISNMTLWRWVGDEALGFPRPMHIKNRRFWKLDELERWEAQQLAQRATVSA